MSGKRRKRDETRLKRRWLRKFHAKYTVFFSIVKNLHINPDIWDILIIGVCAYDYINHKKRI